MSYYVYLLSCIRDGERKNFYTGQTKDLSRRVREHKRYAANNKRRKFTGRFDDVELVWYKRVPTRELAEEEEQRIKSFSSARKERLVQSHAG